MLLENIESYYRSKGIYSESFHCRYFPICRRGCEESFTEAKSAFVGTQYERGVIPRLLFVSLDSGDGEKECNKRTPYYVREDIEIRGVKNIGLHWCQTHRLALKLLKQFNQEITYESVTPYFCHVNSAKCCMNNPGKKQARPVLFENCQEYLQEELAILRPDIIVSQGQDAERSLHPILAAGDYDHQLRATRKATLDGRKILWIATYHPCSKTPFWNERDSKWGDYEAAVANFVKEQSK